MRCDRSDSSSRSPIRLRKKGVRKMTIRRNGDGTLAKPAISTFPSHDQETTPTLARQERARPLAGSRDPPDLRTHLCGQAARHLHAAGSGEGVSWDLAS